MLWQLLTCILDFFIGSKHLLCDIVLAKAEKEKNTSKMNNFKNGKNFQMYKHISGEEG